MTALRGVPARLRRARRRGPRSSGADHGFTLVDLLVSMSLMAVLMVLFTGGIIVVYRSFTRDDELVRANLQLHQAFSRLDREIRYASGVTDPGQVNGTWYVEYQVTNTGTARCTQLRFQPTAGLLQSRTSTAGAPPGAWNTLASGVRPPTGAAGGPGRPFAVSRPAATGDLHDELLISLTASPRGTPAGGQQQVEVALTALNTAPTRSPANACVAMERTR